MGDVQNVLRPLGFVQTFALPAQPARYGDPAEPAQHHFEDSRTGTQVVFLAGRDMSRKGNRLPPHQSCFLVYIGADPSILTRVRLALAQHWTCSWHGTT